MNTLPDQIAPQGEEKAVPMGQNDLTLRATLQRAEFTLDVNLTLPGHGVTALFGPSGSGKTTCLRVLAGLERAATGVVQVGEQRWQDSATGLFVPTHRRALGYVFQEASLFPHLTVEGNLRFGFERTPTAQRRHDWRHGLDLLGIGHLLGRRPHELSGGERHRVAIARALATSPTLLLMDEPLAALDAARKAEILPWLEQLHETLDIPVVYVTHALEEAALLADHLVLLEKGQVRGDGPLSDMLTRSDLPLARGDKALSVVHGLCQGHAPDDQLTVYTIDGGSLLVPQVRHHAPRLGAQVRLHIQARDVSLSRVRPEQTSVLNILPAVVTDVVEEGPGQVLVHLRLGERTPLLSRISRLSARRLQVAPGLLLHAQIKGVALAR